MAVLDNYKMVLPIILIFPLINYFIITD